MELVLAIITLILVLAIFGMLAMVILTSGHDDEDNEY